MSQTQLTSFPALAYRAKISISIHVPVGQREVPTLAREQTLLNSMEPTLKESVPRLKSLTNLHQSAL